MKKFFVTLFALVLIFICGQNNFAQAQRYYFSRSSDGDCYIDSEKIELIYLDDSGNLRKTKDKAILSNKGVLFKVTYHLEWLSQGRIIDQDLYFYNQRNFYDRNNSMTSKAYSIFNGYEIDNLISKLSKTHDTYWKNDSNYGIRCISTDYWDADNTYHLNDDSFKKDIFNRNDKYISVYKKAIEMFRVPSIIKNFDEHSIGGVPLFDRNDTVIKIYGQPTKIKGMGGDPRSGFRTYYYGDSIVVNHEEGSLVYILVTANNGWKTSKGLGVGMSIFDAIKIYGYPEIVKTIGNKVLYIYDEKLWITFDKNSNKILKILLYRSTMADFEEFFSNLSERMLK